MRKLICSILFLIFSVQTFAGAFIILDYQLEKAVYFKRCENKLRTAMKCNGKCQVFKKLKQTQEEKYPSKKFGFKVEDLSSRSFFLTIQPLPVGWLSFNRYFHPALPSRPNAGIFRPPLPLAT